jgi:antitoxin VapB
MKRCSGRRSGTTQIAKIIKIGRGQAVRLPNAFRIETSEVFIRRDPLTGDVILSRRPPNWDDLFAALAQLELASDFLDERERDQEMQERDPFAEWRE